MFSSLIHLQYCYTSLVNQIPMGLLLYAHIPTAVVSLLFGGYLLFKNRSIASVALFGVCVLFSFWCFLSISTWFAFLGAANTMFTWSLIDLVSLVFFFLSYYFIYTFSTGEGLPLWQKIVGIMSILPTAYFTFLGSNLAAFDGNACQAIENTSITHILFYIEALFILSTLVFTVWFYRKNKGQANRKIPLLASTGVLIFMVFFFVATLIPTMYPDWQYAYNIEIYGLFGMPFLLMFLGYLIVRYKAFNLKTFGAQMLVFALVVVTASQFLFTQGVADTTLNGVTLLLSLVFGLLLVKSVKREIQAKEDLLVANAGQENLIHIMNHQLKGYLAKGRNVFDELINEPSYQPISDSAKGMMKQGFDSLTEGVGFIQQVLTGSSAATGKLTYNMAPLDFKAVVLEASEKQKARAAEKSLAYDVTIADGEYRVNADAIQIKEAVRNLIDNSIIYTTTGSVAVSLSKANGKVLFAVKDTGVGLAPEDKKRLFTQGGKGKDSLKYNTSSTGYGLAFVKGVVEAHGGHVWAESAGVGKGSQFYMELPEGK